MVVARGIRRAFFLFRCCPQVFFTNVSLVYTFNAFLVKETPLQGVETAQHIGNILAVSFPSAAVTTVVSSVVGKIVKRVDKSVFSSLVKDMRLHQNSATSSWCRKRGCVSRGRCLLWVTAVLANAAMSFFTVLMYLSLSTQALRVTFFNCSLSTFVLNILVTQPAKILLTWRWKQFRRSITTIGSMQCEL